MAPQTQHILENVAPSVCLEIGVIHSVHEEPLHIFEDQLSLDHIGVDVKDNGNCVCVCVCVCVFDCISVAVAVDVVIDTVAVAGFRQLVSGNLLIIFRRYETVFRSTLQCDIVSLHLVKHITPFGEVINPNEIEVKTIDNSSVQIGFFFILIVVITVMVI